MRGVIKFLLTLIVVFVCAWIGLWWYAQGRIQSGFTNWADQQATHGITVAYSSLARGTSPLRALVTINGLTITFPATANGSVPVVTLPSVGLRIEAVNPTVFNVDLPQKMTINAGGNLDLAVNFGSVALSEDLDPNALFQKSVYPFRGGDFSASGIDFLASSGSLLLLHIDNIASHTDINLAAGGGQPALDESVTVFGMALSPLMTRIASIPFDGRINQLNFTLNLSGPVPPGIFALPNQMRSAQYDPQAQQKILIPIIHQWASGGGSGSFATLLAVGPTTANAGGTLKFDANLQPAGTANLTADHLDELTAAITSAYPQIGPSIAQGEAQLTPYISTSPQAGQTLTVNATYGSGAINITGAKVAPLPPLNWATLENPPGSGQ
jgi:hypothetical protein